jgi:hypothetical protein
LAKAEKVFLFESRFKVVLESPWPRKSNNNTLYCFLKSRICLNHIEESPPAPWTKVTHWSLFYFRKWCN